MARWHLPSVLPGVMLAFWELWTPPVNKNTAHSAALFFCQLWRLRWRPRRSVLGWEAETGNQRGSQCLCPLAP